MLFAVVRQLILAFFYTHVDGVFLSAHLEYVGVQPVAALVKLIVACRYSSFEYKFCLVISYFFLYYAYACQRRVWVLYITLHISLIILVSYHVGILARRVVEYLSDITALGIVYLLRRPSHVDDMRYDLPIYLPFEIAVAAARRKDIRVLVVLIRQHIVERILGIAWIKVKLHALSAAVSNVVARHSLSVTLDYQPLRQRRLVYLLFYSARLVRQLALPLPLHI